MLLDPLEEQFHLPACLVKRADSGCRHRKVVGEKYQRLAALRVLEPDAAQMHRIVLAARRASKRNRLIADDARAAICRRRIDAPKVSIRFGAGDEESLCLMHRVKSLEVQIGAIHNVERAGLQHQNIEHLDVAQLAVRDVDKAGNIAAKVEQRMHLHCRLGGAKQRPRKERQAQIDGRRVQRVSRVLQLDAETVAAVESSRLHDQALSKFGVNAPIPRFVGVGQRRAFDLVPEAHVVKLGGLRRQADLDVAQTLAVGQLCKGQYAELIGACHGLYVTISVLAIDDAMKRLPWQKIHELSEQRLADVHEWLRVRYSRNFFGFSF